MGAPAAVVAARFAWVGYKDRIPFLGRRGDADPAGDAATRCQAPHGHPVTRCLAPSDRGDTELVVGDKTTRCQAPRGLADTELVDAGASPP